MVARLVVVLAVAALLSAASHGPAPAPAVAEPQAYVQLRSTAGTAATRLLARAGATEAVPELRVYRLPAEEAERALPRLRALGAVRQAGVDRPVGTLAVAAASDEPLFPDEWWRDVVGIEGLEPPGPGVPVTVVDSGIDVSHPEFAGRPDLQLLNAQEPAPLGGRHGTGVASLVGAPINGVGISGIYPQARLRSWDAALGEGLRLTTTDIVAGILAAARAGRGVINLSLGGPGPDPLIRQAVAAAVRSGSLVVAASGNDGPDGRVTYPAGYPHVLTVGSIGRDGEVSPFSSRSRFVDLVAPGAEIVAAWPINDVESPSGYRLGSGTSFSAPLVSGAAAWVWTRRPELDASQLFDVMRRSARDIGPPGRDNASGFGVLDVGAALLAPPPVPDPLEPNETPELVRNALARGIPPVPAFTTRARPAAGLTARLTVHEDPRDLYKVWIPRGRTVTFTTTADTDVDLGLWRGDTQQISSTATSDRVARSARRGPEETLVYRNAGAGATFLLSATLGRRVTDATYTLRAERPR